MALYNSLFPLPNSLLLISSLLLAAISIILCYRSEHRTAVVMLFFAAFLVRLFAAHLDSFLHTWDEQFHALVARNMMDHPFKPMLRASNLLPYDYKEWCCNHIWLHKQPLFLWQMALSMKIFGVSEYAVRYPAVLMGSIGVVLVYRISFLLTSNKHISFLAALLTCFSFFQLQLLSGYEGMDQNDCAFDFYVLCSIWAYAEYCNEKILRYAVLIGLFAGCAILNKWLTGLLVYSVWIVTLFLQLRKQSVKKEAWHVLVSLLVCALIFLSWQLYILHTFPAEARYEFAFNNSHLFNVVEGHAGDKWYYFYLFPEYFGNFLSWFLCAGLIVALCTYRYRCRLSLSVAFYFIGVLIFFSFLVPTKVSAYFMIVAPLGYLFIAIAIFELLSRTKTFKHLFIPCALAAMALIFDLPDFTRSHDPHISSFIEAETYNSTIYKNLHRLIPPSVKVVLNVKNYAQFMFYNNNMDAYTWSLTRKETDIFRSMHYPVAIFLDSGSELPAILTDYKPLYIIRTTLR